jgi:hypothetical protein
MYDQTDIERARKAGAPDPEGNAKRANEIIALLPSENFKEARKRLSGITDPGIKKDLLIIIEFDETCRCIPRPEARSSVD